jgi:hypothetical protein
MEIKPQAMALPQETEQLEQGKYGPIYPKTPAGYGFTIIAKIIPGREPVFYEYARNIEAAVAAQPDCLISRINLAIDLSTQEFLYRVLAITSASESLL